MDIVLKYFNNRIIRITEFDDLVKILKESMPMTCQLSASLQANIDNQNKSQNGSLILVWQRPTPAANTDSDSSADDPTTTAKKSLPISFTAWLGKSTLRPLINVDTRKFFLTMIGIEQEKIDEACELIKKEDEMNSKKSLLTNPHSTLYQSNKNEDKAEQSAGDNDLVDKNDQIKME